MEKASSLTVSNSQRNSDLKLHVLDIQCLLSKQNMQKGTQCMEEQAVFIGSGGGKKQLQGVKIPSMWSKTSTVRDTCLFKVLLE